MFGLSFSELLVVGIIALVVVGPAKMPELARNLGRFFAQLKHSLDEVKREISLSTTEFERDFRISDRATPETDLKEKTPTDKALSNEAPPAKEAPESQS